MLTGTGAPGKSAYLHATVGNIDILSAMTEEDNRRLLYELAEIREELRQITGCVVVPQPSTQILVFGSQAELDAFLPRREVGMWVLTTKTGFRAYETGMAFALVNERRNYAAFRQEMLSHYGQYLLYKMVPRVPTWIYSGLPDYLSTVAYRKGMVTWGAEVIKLPHEVTYEGKHPFAEMMNDATFVKTDDTWGLWHYWLTQASGRSRDDVRRLFDALRHGSAGNAETVGRILGQPVEDLRKAVQRHISGFKTPVVERPAVAEKLLGPVTFAPATEGQLLLAKATFYSRMHPESSRYKLEMMQLAEAEPTSPRPWEVMAEMAVMARERGDAEYYWRRARELGTKNPYAYLQALREEVGELTGQLGLEPRIGAVRAAALRRLVDTCVGLDAGEYEAYQWLAWIEALAPDPQPARIDRAERSLAQFSYPALYMPLAAARLRSGQPEAARQLLHEYLGTFKENAPNAELAQALLGLIEKGKAASP